VHLRTEQGHLRSLPAHARVRRNPTHSRLLLCLLLRRLRSCHRSRDRLPLLLRRRYPYIRYLLLPSSPGSASVAHRAGTHAVRRQVRRRGHVFRHWLTAGSTAGIHLRNQQQGSVHKGMYLESPPARQITAIPVYRGIYCRINSRE